MESPFRDAALKEIVLSPGFEVFETLLWDGRTAVRGTRHLARAEASCRALGLPFDGARAEALLAGLGPEARRLRLGFRAEGEVVRSLGPAPAPVEAWVLALAEARLAAGDPWLRLKTSRRAVHDAARAGLAGGIDEAVFLNERGEVCEGTISNLFFDAGEGLRTPPLGCGLLPGVLRAEMLETGRAREAVLRVEDLGRVRLWCGNSLRGLIPARMG